MTGFPEATCGFCELRHPIPPDDIARMAFCIQNLAMEVKKLKERPTARPRSFMDEEF